MSLLQWVLSHLDTKVHESCGGLYLNSSILFFSIRIQLLFRNGITDNITNELAKSPKVKTDFFISFLNG